MSNNIISNEEFYQIKGLDVQKIIDSMEAYLIGYNGYKYNMHEVGKMVFGHENYSFTVSLIHRCYNFFGKNSGKYTPKCAFERKYGYRVTRNDIEAFVVTYPNGTFNLGITFEDFLINRVKSASTQRPKPQPVQTDMTHQYSNPLPPVDKASQLTIGELRRRSPDELTPRELATLKSLGYEYDSMMGWRSPEQIAEDKAWSEYLARQEAERKAKAEYEAKMAAAGYIKVGNEWDGYQWLTQEQIALQQAATLAIEKGRLMEHVIEQVNAGQLEFDVALLGHLIPGYKPEQTYSFPAVYLEKNKLLPFLPTKKRHMLMTYPSFHLLLTDTYMDDIEDVNAVYLIPRGYRIAKVTTRGKLPVRHDRPELPDAILVKLTCEDLRNEVKQSDDNVSTKCPQCGESTMPDSVFCSQCGTKLK